ncbi:uncharacterized protein LOC143214591 [Lasioglossum baleicum]|uniref:uncharacterized protein LOC143214591 n=1 Tax=Lasioglossum baleicum TaxID=434251 RepID=UPI003FCC6EC4
MALTDSAILSRQSSDSSVVYLGSFQKIPELVNLEDSGDNCETKMAYTQQEIRSSRSQKMEPINTKTLVIEL